MTDFIKAGGLGDVSAALPRALKKRHAIRILIPGYRQVLAQSEGLEIVARLSAFAELPPCDLGFFQTSDGLPVYILICPDLFERDGTPYVDAEGRDWADNHVRFGRLSLAAAEIASGCDPNWRPNLVHANDWPTALAPAYLRWQDEHIASVFTIHNLAYQGVFPRHSIQSLGIPEAAFQVDGVEFYNQLCFLKAGIFYSSHITTVSESYAKEITQAESGCGLDGLLRTRAAEGRLSGILNGIDEQWDPRSDRNLFRNFEPGDWKGKRENLDAIRKHFGLAVSRGPLFSVVSRLVGQKGIDLVVAATDEIVSAGGQLVIIGAGERAIEREVMSLADRFPGKVAARIGFDEKEAKNVYAASDFLLMPSRFEPCGLSQMYAQRYGALPIAHRIGGLADSIQDGVNGILFKKPKVSSLYGALMRAFGIYGTKPRLNSMRRAAMNRPIGWGEACSGYERVYARSIGNA